MTVAERRTPPSTKDRAAGGSSRRLWAPALLVPLLGGCDEGGGGGAVLGGDGGSPAGDEGGIGSPGGGGAGDGTDGGGEGVNGPLEGTMVFALGAKRVAALDLRSGVFADLADGNASLAENTSLYEDASLFLERDRSRERGMVGTAVDCLGPTEVNSRACALLMNGEGRIEGGFAFRDDLTNFKRSPSGRHLATMLRDFQDGGATVAFFTTDGELVSTHFVGGPVTASFPPYDWLADGRLVYAEPPLDLAFPEPPRSDPPQLRTIRPDDVDSAAFFSLEGYEGTIQDLAISPTNDRLALTLDGIEEKNGLHPGFTFRRPVVVDLSTFDAYEPIAYGFGDGVQTDYIEWSPDGRWLYFTFDGQVTEGTINDGAAEANRVFDKAFAVRIDGESYFLPLEASESTEKARMVVLRPLNEPQGGLEEADVDDLVSGPVWFR